MLLTLPLLLAPFQQTVAPMTTENSFPFVIPWNDALPGTASDVSFMNEKPAGKNGRIIVRNGHFAEAKTGKRIRFFATNAAGAAAFPAKDEADAIAAHMAKLGINLVRLHHLQNGWGVETGESVWKKGKVFLEADPAQLDKLDFFIAALKRHGIYVNVNLQTARNYLPEMGLPASVTQIPNFGKKADKFFDRMIELQREYVRMLLDRKNPYTGIRYCDDPAVAIVEINNENSLVGWPGESPGAGLSGFPEPFVRDLTAKWNRWLVKNYVNDQGVRTAWQSQGRPLGSSLTSHRTAWTWENQSGSDVTIKAVEPSGGNDYADGLDATVRSHNGPVWHIQAHVPGLTLTNNETYTVTFRARADQATSVGVDTRLDQPDWRNLGLSGTSDLGPDWKEYALTFRAVGAEPNHARISFVLGGSRGLIQIRELRLRPGMLVKGLDPAESAEAGTVPLASVELSPRFRDYTRFLVETETKFSEGMRKFLRDELGFKKTNILDSQVAWGGLTSLVRERSMEYADNHAYWNHPTFLGSDWDTKNYRVERKPLVAGLLSNTGTLGELALYRVVGKPYSVSEYNHPAPSDFQIEMMPMISTFAAAQDWDAIYTFAWEATGKRYRNELYDGYFDVARNPAKAAFFPSSALIFRRGLVPPLPGSQYLTVPGRPWETAMTPNEAWSQAGQTPDPLHQRVGVGLGPDSVPKVTGTRIDGLTTLGVRGPANARIYIADTPSSLSFTGFVGDKRVETIAGSFTFGTLPTGFASLTLVPTDDLPLRTSKRVLLTLGSRVENEGMAWNPARDSVSDQWGKGPVRAESVRCLVELKVDGPRRVFALDGTGKRIALIPTGWNRGRLTFQTARAKSMWIEVVK